MYNFKNFKVLAIPLFKDNYSYLVNFSSQLNFLIDPADP